MIKYQDNYDNKSNNIENMYHWNFPSNCLSSFLIISTRADAGDIPVVWKMSRNVINNAIFYAISFIYDYGMWSKDQNLPTGYQM